MNGCQEMRCTASYGQSPSIHLHDNTCISEDKSGLKCISRVLYAQNWKTAAELMQPKCKCTIPQTSGGANATKAQNACSIQKHIAKHQEESDFEEGGPMAC